VAKLTEVRRTLREKLADVPGHVRVFLGRSNYGKDGTDKLRFTARVIVGPQDDPEVEDHLDVLASRTEEGSVKRLLETDDTLGGLVLDVTVTETTGVRAYPGPHPASDREPVPHLGAEWTVELLTDGDV
jgi:hypothetical protein